MALVKELLVSNEELKGLSDAQIKAIETLSANEEKTVLASAVGKAVGQLHEMYDKDIATVTGEAKLNETEKSYEFNKRVLTTYKAKVDEADKLKAKIADYEIKIKEGAVDAVVKQKLIDAESKLEAAQRELAASGVKLTEIEMGYVGKLNQYKVDTEMAKAAATLKFKTGYSDTIKNTLLNAARAEILGENKADFVEENGNTHLVFRDKDGKILLTKENGLNPTTPLELLRIKLGDALDAVEGAGAGTKKPKPGDPAPVSIVDLGAAKSQVQADSIIVAHLNAEGFVRGSTKFAEKQKEIRDQYKVSELPIK